MHIQTSFWALAAGVNLCLAGFPQRASPNALRARAEKFRPAAPEVQAVAREAATTQPLHRRDSPYLNNQTQKFSVNGTSLPDINFDIGESYAGLLPISEKKNETRELFFWFFPSSNPAASNEITIWFNGGPGCSSLLGLMQENGPFLWQPGTYLPTQNPYAWRNLTNMLYVEQPVGVGFSRGTSDIQDELGLSKEFVGFYKNFESAFEVQDHDVYVTGESYGGYYVPYVSDALITAGFNLKGSLIYDPIIGDGLLQFELPAVPFVDYWSNLFNFNKTFMADIHSRQESCGYQAYLDAYFTFPPPGPFPVSPNEMAPGCDLNDDIFAAELLVNPCWNYYHVSETCPFKYDPLGDDAYGSNPKGFVTYFNRPKVQAAIHVPPTKWSECVDGVFSNGGKNKMGDLSEPPAINGVLQRVVEKTNNVLIGQGQLDYVLMTNGTLLALQNMTWNGAQGFSEPPTLEHFVPYHTEYNAGALSGAGIVGTYRTERGLTFVNVELAGHEVPEYHAGAAYRHMELLLGRIKDLGQMGPFTTQNGTGMSEVVGVMKKPVEFRRGDS